MLHFHTSSFTILVQRHLLIYYIYSSPIDTKLVENASLPLIPSQSSPRIYQFVHFYTSAYPLSLLLSTRIFSSCVYFPAAESLLSPRLILHWLSSSLTRCIRQQCATRFQNLYTHTHTRTSVHRHANVRSIFIYNRSSFILFFLLFFSFFFSPPFLLAFVPQTILLSSPGIWNQTGVTHVAYAQSPLDRSHRNYECV